MEDLWGKLNVSSITARALVCTAVPLGVQGPIYTRCSVTAGGLHKYSDFNGCDTIFYLTRTLSHLAPKRISFFFFVSFPL